MNSIKVIKLLEIMGTELAKLIYLQMNIEIRPYLYYQISYLARNSPEKKGLAKRRGDNWPSLIVKDKNNLAPLTLKYGQKHRCQGDTCGH